MIVRVAMRAWATAILAAGVLTTRPVAAEVPSAEACASTAEHATDLRDAGHLREALGSFAICARAECPRIVREDCRRGLQAINDGPHLLPRVRDRAGNDVLDVELLLDD